MQGRIYILLIFLSFEVLKVVNEVEKSGYIKSALCMKVVQLNESGRAFANVICRADFESYLR